MADWLKSVSDCFQRLCQALLANSKCISHTEVFKKYRLINVVIVIIIILFNVLAYSLINL